MALIKYLCTRSNDWQGVFWKKGVIYPISVGLTPPAGFFSVTADDPRSRMSQGTRDLDNTWYPLNGGVGWDDWTFPATRLRQGATQKPDFDPVEIGLLFPQNDPDEIVYATAIASHTFSLHEGALWKPHIHFIQSEANIPIFKLDYRVTPITASGASPGAFTTIQTLDEVVVPYSSGDISQIIEFPDIDVWAAARGDPGIAPTIDFRLYRDDNVVTGDVLLKTFDIHVPADAPLGSGQEFIK